MEKKRIVFVLNSITITRCQKRVQEFIDHGYKVDVYGFARGGETYASPAGFFITQIGFHPVSMNYFKRLFVIAKALINLHKKYKHENNLMFYYFFFDVAFVASFISKRPYIYEESDMPYTNLNNGLLRNFLGWYDRRIIRRSQLTIMTSEGFIDYHGLKNQKDNIIIVPNRVNPALLNYAYHHKSLDINNISVGFVGGFRYQSVFNFTKEVITRYPNITFHVFGNINQFGEELKTLNAQYPNLIVHGVFKNPEDLPYVYESLDLVLATYDATSINAQYAEPNKMYESIFFRVPIVVSKGTFLSKKVERLGIGYSVDALNVEDIHLFIQSLTENNIREKIRNLSGIPQETAVNNNPGLFEYLSIHGI